VGDRLLFEAVDGQGKDRLFATPGTPAATVQLSGASIQGPLVAVSPSGKAVFLADDGIHGAEPWTSDGTPAGTALLKDVCSGPCGVVTDPPLQALAGAAFFRAGDPQQGDDLWRSDGTAAGTRRFTDFGAPPPVVAAPLASAAGKVFFAAADPEHGGELWLSDGGSGGTRRVTDIGRRAPSSDPAELTAWGGNLAFTACDGTNRGVWTSDGSFAGTLPVTTSGGSPASPCADAADRPRDFTLAGNGIYFLAGSGANLNLWRLAGSTAASVFHFPATLPLDPSLSGTDSGLFFAVEAASGTPIYRLDAGSSTPQLLSTTSGGLRDLHGLTVLGSQAFYVAEQSGSFAAYVTDAAGTRQLTGPVSVDLSGPADATFRRFGATVLVSGTDLSDPENPVTSLWATDGTPAGTHLLHAFGGVSDLPHLTEASGALYFLDLPDPDSQGGGGTELWRTDGTPGGTARVANFPATAGNVASEPVWAAGRLFFAAGDDDHGTELWATDTAGAGGLVLDLLPGPESGQPSGLTGAGGSGGQLFFTANDGVHGVELWVSDGTAAGTHLVDDLAPGGGASNPDGLTVAGGRLYFAADDGLSGREPWSLALASSGCQPSDARLCLAGGRFQVEIHWQDFQGHTGSGHTVPLTADTGAFWFFDATNLEVIVKVLDARALNQAFWVFYGALSSVPYSITVTDTATGLTRRYDNPSGVLASVGDTNGFGPQGASFAAAPTPAGITASLAAARTDPAAATGSCAPTATRLCLQGGRFALTAAWKDFQGHTGNGTAVSLTPDTGYFWFFAPTNVEVVAKVLDGRGLNGKFWLFYGALSNVEYTLTVTDTQTGAVKTYRNPLGQFGSVGDTGAF
ncbi:MAG TPA: ELWxxDGT repeat protein, partial [Thermoanaerobaculia bacterium]|nr:ELWxxDGT repeat protein [Thermoanaerobaculia bacterium]